MRAARLGRPQVGAVPGPGGQPVDLTFWTSLPVIGRQPVRTSSAGTIQVSLQVRPGRRAAAGTEKMYSALRAGNAPDLAHVSIGVPSFLSCRG